MVNLGIIIMENQILFFIYEVIQIQIIAQEESYLDSKSLLLGHDFAVRVLPLSH